MKAKTEREPCEPSPALSSPPSDKPTDAERGREIAELVLMGLKLGVTEEQRERQRQQEAARSLQPFAAETPAPHSSIYEKAGPRDEAYIGRTTSVALIGRPVSIQYVRYVPNPCLFTKIYLIAPDEQSTEMDTGFFHTGARSVTCEE